MKKPILFFLFQFLSLAFFAQHYMTAGGLRMGTDWGITVQQRVMNKMTVEAIIQSSLQREEVLVTGLLEKHYPLISKGFNVYTGGGLHKGWTQSENPEVAVDNPFGLTFVMGAELTLGRLNLSYDFKPAINISGGEKAFYTQTGVSLRYVLLKNKEYKKIQKNKKKRKKEKAKSNKSNENPKWKFWKKD